MDYVVIMAGGSGTRLWPLSRRGMPKQLLPFIDGRSLLQLAYDRAKALVDPSRIIVCAGRDYAQIISEQLPDLPKENQLSEPEGRDSCAAVTWSVATIAQRDPDAVVAVLGADHIITPQAALISVIKDAFSAAREHPTALVTLGVVPQSPHTGYGYLHRGPALDDHPTVFTVQRFAEKPDLATAKDYVSRGGWLWNSGMFIWRAETYLDQIRILEPELLSSIEDLVANPDRIDEIYPTLKKTSVDYAVMEPSTQGKTSASVLVVALEGHWADIGSFPSLADALEGGENKIEGLAVTLEAHGNLIMNRGGDGKLIAVCGVDDLVIVQEGDITLVCSKSHAESVKELRELAYELGENYG
ncbi:MAG: mannose-1-phosphate guanylyltransferase [Propionibacteriaceae bacterium]|jgi:mannose-1-phosphate guanylyltransferase|nr:mannose-1-phosphate guanylyltransferase [Propionibacteriaceae bacterium]